jgi:hypothetical protein
MTKNKNFFTSFYLQSVGTLLKILFLIRLFSNCSFILPNWKNGFILYQKEIYIDPIIKRRTDGIFEYITDSMLKSGIKKNYILQEKMIDCMTNKILQIITKSYI